MIFHFRVMIAKRNFGTALYQVVVKVNARLQQARC
jgi:hypothetical protein